MVDRSISVVQARDPPLSLVTFGGTSTNIITSIITKPNQMVSLVGSDELLDVRANMSSDNEDRAEDLVLRAVEQFGTEDIKEALDRDLFEEFVIGISESNNTMMDIITTAVAAYMDTKDGEKPLVKSLKGGFELMESSTTGVVVEVGKMIRDMSVDNIISFFDEDLVAWRVCSFCIYFVLPVTILFMLLIVPTSYNHVAVVGALLQAYMMVGDTLGYISNRSRCLARSTYCI